MQTSRWRKLADAAQVLGRDFLVGRAGLSTRPHPFLAGFGGAFRGLLAFAVVLMVLSALFALLGVALRVALVVGGVVLAWRVARRLRRPATAVLIVPPDHRSPRRS